MTAGTPSRAPARFVSTARSCAREFALPFVQAPMPQESSASACCDSLVAAPNTRDLLFAMLRSAEGGTSDSGGSEVSPSHKRRSERRPQHVVVSQPHNMLPAPVATCQLLVALSVGRGLRPS